MTDRQHDFHVRRNGQENAAAATARDEQTRRIHADLALLHAKAAGLTGDPADAGPTPPALLFASAAQRDAATAIPA